MFSAPRYTARVELSSKVLDDPTKLQRTLAHELAHVAAWTLDHVAKPPHGPHFKAWAHRITAAYPHLEISTCHSYEIAFKHYYQCLECGQSYGRHSQSIDCEKQACGVCRGRLVYAGRTKPALGSLAGGGGAGADTERPKRAATGFALYVRENFARKRAAMGAAALPRAAADVMRALGVEYGEAKARGGTGTAS